MTIRVKGIERVRVGLGLVQDDAGGSMAGTWNPCVPTLFF
jgi:hypothetical protein